MRPWFHKSELANYLEGQRSLCLTGLPSPPAVPSHSTQLPPEELRKLDQMTTSLHNLRLRLANDEELTGHVDHVTTYLQQIRQDLPLQAPEKAFDRMQHLRSLLFWLPPAILRAGEPDLGSITMLCHFYAVALVLEPLFPEIGGAYLGGLSVGPIEYMQEMLQRRKSSLSQDNGLQVALGLIETPVQIAAAYRASKRQLGSSADLYQRSPQSSPFVSPHLQLASTPDIPPTSGYSHPPLQSPRGHQLPGTSYFASSGGPSHAREPHILRSTGERQLSVGSPLSHVSFVQQDSPGSHPMGHSIASGVDYYGQSAYQQSQPYSVADSRFVNTPSSVWT